MTTYIDNKKVYFDHEVLEKYEAGVELFGFEVKSLKNSQGSLDGAYVLIRGGEAFVMNMLIPPYQEKNTPKDYEPRRNRRLLITKKDMAKLAGTETDRGLTIVPVSIYNKNNLIKISVAVVRGKKKYDKREVTKRREVDRSVRREFSDR